MANIIPNALEALKRNVDPLIEAISPEELIAPDLVISEFGSDIQKTPIVTPESGYISIWGIVSSGNTRIGDTWEYRSGDYKFMADRIKSKKFTSQVRLSEDELDRIKMDNNMFIKGALDVQIKMESRRMSLDMEKMAFGLNAGDAGYDPDFISPLKLNATSSVANPQDCCPTPGTAMDLSAINWTGTAQTMRNVENLVGAIEKQIAAIQSLDTNYFMDWSQRTLIVCPILYAILSSYKDIKTAQQVSTMTYKQELEAAGYRVIKSRFADTSYTSTTSGTTSNMIVVGNINTSFMKCLISPADGFNWTPWREIPSDENGVMKFFYEKHKKAEWYLLARAYSVRNSDGTHVWKKPLMHISTTPFENS